RPARGRAQGRRGGGGQGRVLRARADVWRSQGGHRPRRHEAFDARTRRPADDDDAFDERGVIRDGYGMRVPLYLMDSMQRAIAVDARRRRKIVGRDPFGRVASSYEEEEEEDAMTIDAALHRPGYRTSATVNDDEAVAAYREYVRNLTDSWRTTDQAAPRVGPKEGDACMTDDKQPGRWVCEGGALVCRPTQCSDAAPAG